MRSVAAAAAAANMEVFVSSSSFNFSFSNSVFPDGSVVRDLLNRFVQQQGVCSSGDLYLVKNGRLCQLEDPLQSGSVYRLEPRLCGGKGGFGSMLRALGAQIEKTTNREACRDLSGRRLRDVNHEKEMADWLQQQSTREAEKEQRRMERLQRKLAEPKHHFNDPEYQQQCHDLSERLEDSVLKGLQASCSQQLKVSDASASKSDVSEPPLKKRKETEAACFWMGDMPSSEEDDDDDEDESPTSSCGTAAVAMTTQTGRMESEQSSRPSPLQTTRPSGAPRPSKTCTDQKAGPSNDPSPLETCADQTVRPSGDPRPSKTCSDQKAGPSKVPSPPKTCADQKARPLGDPRPPESCSNQTARPSEDLKCPETCPDQKVQPLVDLSSSSSLKEVQPPVDLSSSSSLEVVQPPVDLSYLEVQPPVDLSALSSLKEVQPPVDLSALSSLKEVQPPVDLSSPSSLKEVQPPVDLSSLSSLEEVQSLGLERLKQELIRRGLKCGGTLTERAARLFSVRGLTPDQIDPALLAKPTKAKRK